MESVNGVTPTGGAVTIDLGVTSVNGQTGDVTITERSVKQLIDIIYQGMYQNELAAGSTITLVSSLDSRAVDYCTNNGIALGQVEAFAWIPAE